MKISELAIGNFDFGSDIRRTDNGSKVGPYEAWQLVALHEILVELRKLNTLLHCGNFVNVPHKLERIAKNTTKPKRRRKVKP